jgi:hypothetical protein
MTGRGTIGAGAVVNSADGALTIGPATVGVADESVTVGVSAGAGLCE